MFFLYYIFKIYKYSNIKSIVSFDFMTLGSNGDWILFGDPILHNIVSMASAVTTQNMRIERFYFYYLDFTSFLLITGHSHKKLNKKITHTQFFLPDHSDQDSHYRVLLISNLYLHICSLPALFHE